MPDAPKPQQDNKAHQFRDVAHKSMPGRLPFRNETLGAAPYHATGAEALSPLLASVRFPIDKADLMARLGHARIPTSRHGTRLVSELLERTVPRSFASRDAVVSAVGRVLDEFEAREPGASGWARSLHE